MMKLKRREAGASMVMVAVMMSVLLTLVAGTISFAAGSSQKVDLQNSADSTARAIMKECIRILAAGSVNSAGCPTSNTVSPWMLNKLRSGDGAAGANMTVQIHRKTLGSIANAPYMVTVNATRTNTAPLTKVIGAEGAQIGAKSVVSYAVPQEYEPPVPLMFDYCYLRSLGGGVTAERSWQIRDTLRPHEDGEHHSSCRIAGQTYTKNYGHKATGWDGPREGVGAYILGIADYDSATGIALYAPDGVRMNESRAASVAAGGPNYPTECPVARPTGGAFGTGYGWIGQIVSTISNWGSRVWSTMDRACIRNFSELQAGQKFWVPVYGHKTEVAWTCTGVMVFGACIGASSWKPDSKGVEIVEWREFQLASSNPAVVNVVLGGGSFFDQNARRAQCLPGYLWVYPSSWQNYSNLASIPYTTTEIGGSAVGCWKIRGSFTSAAPRSTPPGGTGEFEMVEDISTYDAASIAKSRIKMIS